MRKNEYTTLEDFTSQYVGEWNPSEGHWLGLDFSYKGTEWRFQTHPMYKKDAFLLDGREALFGLYKKLPEPTADGHEYELLGEYATIDEVLNSSAICDTPFKIVITDADTELLGQD